MPTMIDTENSGYIDADRVVQVTWRKYTDEDGKSRTEAVLHWHDGEELRTATKRERYWSPQELSVRMIPAHPGYFGLDYIEPDEDHPPMAERSPVLAWRIWPEGDHIEPVCLDTELKCPPILHPDGHVTFWDGCERYLPSFDAWMAHKAEESARLYERAKVKDAKAEGASHD